MHEMFYINISKKTTLNSTYITIYNMKPTTFMLFIFIIQNKVHRSAFFAHLAYIWQG